MSGQLNVLITNHQKEPLVAIMYKAGQAPEVVWQRCEEKNACPFQESGASLFILSSHFIEYALLNAFRYLLRLSRLGYICSISEN